MLVLIHEENARGHRLFFDPDDIRHLAARRPGLLVRAWPRLRLPDPSRELEAELRMTDSDVVLDREQRQLVEKTIADHCRVRKWILHAVNCRSNHAHVLVTAPDRPIEVPREQFKSWCTRKLKEHARRTQSKNADREKWWTEREWDEYIDDDDALAEANCYIRERQDR
jgi:REP element-mobilizing transposase RayT